MYIGVYICLRVVSESGNEFGSRSIPEYLGDRYKSDRIRVIAALMSLILFFYLAGQLVAGLVMFETMLGLAKGPALIITTGVLLLYVTLGGAHADILTDAFQGTVMLVIAVGVSILFFTGFGVEGGLGGVMQRLVEMDPDTVQWLHPTASIVSSPWAIVAIIIAHIPLGMLPHIGNKLWALKSATDRRHGIHVRNAVTHRNAGWLARARASWRFFARRWRKPGHPGTVYRGSSNCGGGILVHCCSVRGDVDRRRSGHFVGASVRE
jgi:sodium/proline symporter